MAGTPIWTAKTDKGLSASFEVSDIPMTISVDNLEAHEVVHVRSSNQDDTAPVPFRSDGNVQLDYNNTKINIYTKGRFYLELTEAPRNAINATRI